jgi:hypothetical protein
MTKTQAPEESLQNMGDQDSIAAKLRLRIQRRRQLGYRNVPVSLFDLECLIDIATPREQ